MGVSWAGDPQHCAETPHPSEDAATWTLRSVGEAEAPIVARELVLGTTLRDSED